MSRGTKGGPPPRPPIKDSPWLPTTFATECGDVEVGEGTMTFVFTEDRFDGKGPPVERRVVARVAISVPAAPHMMAKIQSVLTLLAEMRAAAGQSRN